jgi:hypothetical protein
VSLEEAILEVSIGTNQQYVGKDTFSYTAALKTSSNTI